MLLSYIKIAFRNLNRNILHSSINILGMAIGLACTILIINYVFYELSYDRFRENAEKLQIVLAVEHYQNSEQMFSETPGPLAHTLKNEFPEIENTTRMCYTNDYLVNYQDIYFIEDRILAVDPQFLEMFSFPLIKGSPQTALNAPNSILLTEEIAQKYFGNENPLGKTIHIDPEFDFTVSGILEKLPQNSMFDFEILVPVNTHLVRFDKNLESWQEPSIDATFILLKDAGLTNSVNDKIKDVIANNSPDKNISLKLFPFLDIHTHPEFVTIKDDFITLNTLIVYAIVALLILLVAAVNFINLSTALYSKRLKEIAIKKVAGASRKQIARQFAVESIIVIAISLLFSLGIMELTLPLFNNITGRAFASFIFLPSNLWILILVAVFILILSATVFPSLYISKLKASDILRKQIFSSIPQSRARKILVVLQFALSVFFIIAAISVFRQFYFMKNFNPGYDNKNIIAVPILLHWEHRADGTFYRTLKNELLSLPAVSNVTQTFQTPGDIITSAGEAKWEGAEEDQSVLIHWLTVHFDFYKLLNIPIVKGRTFSPDYPEDLGDWNSGSIILNEAAVKMMNIEDPIGKWFQLYGKKGQIVGICADFNYRALTQNIEPLAMFVEPFFNHMLLIKIDGTNTQETIQQIELIWQKYAQHVPFSYTFVEDKLNDVYSNEQRTGILLYASAIMAILISCLGLLGLVVFSIQQKTKEIGVRKVLGSSTYRIWKLLTVEYVKLILIANIISWPLAYFIVNQWMQNFMYRTEISLVIFLLAGISVFAIALVTIGFFVYKAAHANPVEALRYE